MSMNNNTTKRMAIFKKWRAEKLVSMIDAAMIDMERNVLRSVSLNALLHFRKTRDCQKFKNYSAFQTKNC